MCELQARAMFATDTSPLEVMVNSVATPRYCVFHNWAGEKRWEEGVMNRKAPVGSFVKFPPG